MDDENLGRRCGCEPGGRMDGEEEIGLQTEPIGFPGGLILGLKRKVLKKKKERKKEQYNKPPRIHHGASKTINFILNKISGPWKYETQKQI